MLITLYAFSKYPNSTAHPDSEGVEVNGTIKESSSIISPNISFHMENPYQYNYAFIPTFNRYYWINNWLWEGPNWVASMRVDVLATYRAQIGNATEYVVRSSAESDPRVADTTYPAKAMVDFSSGNLTGLQWASDISNGCYVLANRTGVTNFLLLTPAEMQSLCSWLFSTEPLEEMVPEMAADFPWLKGIYNPVQYIESLTWYPFPKSAIPSPGARSTFHYGVGGGNSHGYTQIPASGRYETGVTLQLPNHPQLARGKYLNYPPYTSYTIYIPPWGYIDVPPEKLWADTDTGRQLNISIHVDLRSGVGTLNLSSQTSDFALYQTQIGVAASYAQSITPGVGEVDYFQNAVDAMNLFLNPASALSTGSRIVNHVGDMAQRMLPKVNYLSGGGGFSELSNQAKYFARFAVLVDEDLAHRGRPLCANRQLSTIPGFIQVADAEISTTGTEEENNEIRRLMEEGFYYA